MSESTEVPKKHPRNWKKLFCNLLELIVILLIFFHLSALGIFKPSWDTQLYRPVPDVVEYVWVAEAFAHGRSPLMPIGNELHPSRFSLVHPLLASTVIPLSYSEFTAFHLWSMIASVAMCLLFLGTLALLGVGALLRIFFLIAFCYSPLFVELTQGFYQETSIGLLLSGMLLTLVCWNVTQEKKERFSHIMIFICGICCALLFAIRPTYIIYPVLIFLFLLCQFRDKKKILSAGIFASSILLSLIVLYVLSYKVYGLVGLTFYDHWIPNFGVSVFSVRNAFRSLSHLPDQPVLWTQMLFDLLGFNSQIHSGGLALGVLMITGTMIGSSIHVWKVKKGTESEFSNKGNLILLVIFSAISQFVIHLIYTDYGIRFAMTWYPLLLIALCFYANQFQQDWFQSKIKPLFAYQFILPALLLGLAGFTILNFYPALEDKKLELTQRQELHAYRMTDHYVDENFQTRSMGPLFLEDFPTLNFRLQQKMTAYPYPILPIWVGVTTFKDGHFAQISTLEVGEPIRRLNNNPRWPQIKNSFLLVKESNTNQNYGNLALLEYLVQSYGEIHILISKRNRSLIDEMLETSEFSFTTVERTDDFQPYVLITILADPDDSERPQLNPPEGEQLILLHQLQEENQS